MTPKRQPGPIATALMTRGGGCRAEKTVRRLAHDVQRTHGCTSIPIEVMDCARSLELRVARADIATDGSLIDWDGDDCQILLSQHAPAYPRQRQRERFTIAHEIGHFVLRRYLQTTVPRHLFERHNSEEEYLCNIFAAELLIPTMDLRRDVTQFGMTACAVLRLRERYDVSLPVLLIKLWELFGRKLFITTWKSWQDGSLAVTGTYPRTSRRVEFVKPYTSVHHALQTRRECEGFEVFILDGRQARWKCWSAPLGDGGVLTVGMKASLWHRYAKSDEQGHTQSSPQRFADQRDSMRPHLILQTSFPFTDASSSKTSLSMTLDITGPTRPTDVTEGARSPDGECSGDSEIRLRGVR